MKGEQIPVVLRLMVKERERWKENAPTSSGGGGLYRVRHPLTSYVTKWGMNAYHENDVDCFVACWSSYIRVSRMVEW